MEYELARQLKDAGFPQEGAGKRVADPEKIFATREDFAYVPTLDELIEACGNRFEGLTRDDNGIWGGQANSMNTISLGSTPTETVARLWLSLNSQCES